MRHSLIQRRLALTLLVVTLAIGAAGCASTGTSQARIAHYGTSVLEELRLAQAGVISLNTSQVLPDTTTRNILDGIKKANDAAGKLSDALKVYNGAASADTLGKVNAALMAFQVVLVGAFNVDVPPAAVSQIQALAANVNKTVLAIQLEIAKGRS